MYLSSNVIGLHFLTIQDAQHHVGGGQMSTIVYYILYNVLYSNKFTNNTLYGEMNWGVEPPNPSPAITTL